MARINLRPWREELRIERQKQFVGILLGFLIISAGIGFLWYQQVLGSIDQQKQRNNYVQNEITQLEKQIKEINELKKKREAMIERMQVIQDLQGKRPVIVRLFDELVRTVPEGVYLTSWENKSGGMSVKGVGESNSRISNLMRSLNDSDWYQDPNLTSVKAVADTKSAFEMTVKQEAPDANVEGEG